MEILVFITASAADHMGLPHATQGLSASPNRASAVAEDFRTMRAQAATQRDRSDGELNSAVASAPVSAAPAEPPVGLISIPRAPLHSTPRSPVGFTAKRLQGLSPEACRPYREAGAGLSPGWRLCGTLGVGHKNRVL
jgi:hypothetical protein